MEERQGGTWSSVCVWAWWRIKWERWRFTKRFTHTIKQRNIKKNASFYFGKKCYYPLRLFNERRSFAQSVCWCVHTTLLQSRLFTFMAEEFMLFLMVLFSTNAGCEITCSGSRDGTICKNLLPLKMIFCFGFFLSPCRACRGQRNKH